MNQITPPPTQKRSFPDRATTWIGSVQSLVVHTVLFVGCFISILFGADADSVMLMLTTAVSLEAIYLGIFIQISVNRNTADIAEIQADVEDIEESIDEIADDVEGIEKDIDEIAEDMEGIEKDIEEIQADVEEIADDVEGIEKDIEEISDDMESIEKDIDEIAEDIEDIEESIDEDDQTAPAPSLTESQHFILESLLKEMQGLKTKLTEIEGALKDKE